MINTIDNQPIRLRPTNVIHHDSCECHGQSYCQLVEKYDQTQFQIKGVNEVINGNFQSGLDGWEIMAVYELILITQNESEEGACDGVITVWNTDALAEYSINGGPFVSPSGPQMIFEDLCAGEYVISARYEPLQGSGTAIIETNVACGDYNDSELNDISDIGLSKFGNCELNDFN